MEIGRLLSILIMAFFMRRVSVKRRILDLASLSTPLTILTIGMMSLALSAASARLLPTTSVTHGLPILTMAFATISFFDGDLSRPN